MDGPAAETSALTQLSLFSALTRWEIPTGYWSWRDGDTVVRVTQGAYCIDTSWKFFKPWRPWDGI